MPLFVRMRTDTQLSETLYLGDIEITYKEIYNKRSNSVANNTLKAWDTIQKNSNSVEPQA